MKSIALLFASLFAPLAATSACCCGPACDCQACACDCGCKEGAACDCTSCGCQTDGAKVQVAQEQINAKDSCCGSGCCK